MPRDFVLAQAYMGPTFLPVGRTDPSSGPFSWLDMNGAIWALCNSPYFSGLEQYGCGRVSLGGPHIAVDTDAVPGDWSHGTQDKGFTDVAIASFFVKMIDKGLLTAPTGWNDGETPVYLVFLPQGLYSKDHFEAAIGYHWQFLYQGTWSLCAWVMQGDSLNDTTKIMAHEVVEAISATLGGGEVGDGCDETIGSVHGVIVQGYHSARDGGACIIPGKLELTSDHVPSSPFSTTRVGGRLGG